MPIGEVERWWRDAVDGRCPRSEVSAWAEARLGDSSAEVGEELVLQAVLVLQGWTGDRDLLRAGLERWRAELRRYDADPVGWDRRYFQGVLTSFLATHTVERTRAFGRRLVRDGLLTDEDVEAALGG